MASRSKMHYVFSTKVVHMDCDTLCTWQTPLICLFMFFHWFGSKNTNVYILSMFTEFTSWPNSHCEQCDELAPHIGQSYPLEAPKDGLKSPILNVLLIIQSIY